MKPTYNQPENVLGTRPPVQQYSNRMEQIKAVNEKFGPVYIHDMKAVLK